MKKDSNIIFWFGIFSIFLLSALIGNFMILFDENFPLQLTVDEMLQSQQYYSYGIYQYLCMIFFVIGLSGLLSVYLIEEYSSIFNWDFDNEKENKKQLKWMCNTCKTEEFQIVEIMSTKSQNTYKQKICLYCGEKMIKGELK